MLPRFSTGGSAHRISCSSFTRQCRVSGPSHQKGVATWTRLPAVALDCHLVLRPTGTGNYDHIGDKVNMPQPIPLKDGVFEVGRASPADIMLNIPTVSSRHALLRVEDNKLCITDLNSTNGTMVNGQELTPMDNMEVEIGAEVIFGDMYLARFRLDEMPEHELKQQQSQQMDLLSEQTSGQDSYLNNNETISS
eukprot:GHRR01000675.1.p1 GENE.GHRR01000675.1~~GHRR01000675.1.p1  ORF type:complete len:193 (+),score=38.63 GHRR01000675.1:138-716(+)